MKLMLPDSGKEPERNAEWKKFVTEEMMASEYWPKEGFKTRVVSDDMVVIESTKRQWFGVLGKENTDFGKFLFMNGFRKRSWLTNDMETRFVHPTMLKKPTSFIQMVRDEVRDGRR